MIDWKDVKKELPNDGEYILCFPYRENDDFKPFVACFNDYGRGRKRFVKYAYPCSDEWHVKEDGTVVCYAGTPIFITHWAYVEEPEESED